MIMEKLFELLEVFFEKHLIPTIVAVAGAIYSIAVIPTDYWLVVRLGDTLLGAFMFCLYFSFIKLIIWIYKSILKKSFYSIKYKKFQNKIMMKEYEQALDKLWTIIDDMSPQDREYLIQFIKSNNAPIKTSGIYGGNCLFTSDFVICSKVKTENYSNRPVIVKNERQPMNNELLNKIHTPAIYQYKLKENFYKLLKYSYENYGRISHFDEGDNLNG